jgi:hypothetical protein
MIDRAFCLLVSLSLAALIWLYASSREQEMLDNVPVLVQITLAANQAEQYSLEVTGPSQVPVSFSGPPPRIRELRGLLQRGELRVDISLTVPDDRQEEPRYHDTVRIEAADIPTPPGVKAIIVEGQNRIPVTLRRIVERRLPVRLDHNPEDRLGQVVIDPATVLVRGPQEVLDHMTSIATLPLVLPGRPEAARPETISIGPVPLVEVIDGKAIRTTPESVRVRATLAPRHKPYELEAPIHFLCPANFPRRPRFRNERDGKLALRLIGPATEEQPKVFAFIDLTAPGKFNNTSLYYDEPPQVQLPPGFQLAQPLPRWVTFELGPAEAPPVGPVVPPPP